MNRLFIYLTLILIAVMDNASAQTVEMADTMQAQGKINVVIAVAFLVLTIMSLWLFRIELRIGRLEKNTDSKNRQ